MAAPKNIHFVVIIQHKHSTSLQVTGPQQLTLFSVSIKHGLRTVTRTGYKTQTGYKTHTGYKIAKIKYSSKFLHCRSLSPRFIS